MIVLFCLMVLYPPAAAMTYDECLLNALKTAPAETSVEEIRSDCSRYLNPEISLPSDTGAKPETPDKPSAVSNRLEKEAQTFENPFALTPHRPNYILPATYSTSSNETPSTGSDYYSDNWEIKFQISLKYRVWDNLFQNNGDIYLAYTNQSWWEAYNSDESSPFRETNHEPEGWLQFDYNPGLFGLDNMHLLLGAAHQSNGRSLPCSRSWNRIYLNMIGSVGNLAISLKPWYRIPENLKSSPEDTDGDDNPDISRYMGYGELHTIYKWRKSEFSMMLRNNLRTSENKGAVTLGWTFPLFGKFKMYLQYFNGYGESLIDYNASINRFGAGLILSDWL
jgi:phospholipase A1